MFALDRSFSILSAGSRVDGIVVRDQESAGQVFALRMARREYGPRAGVRAFNHHGDAGENGQIFGAWLENVTGQCGKDVRFAVIEFK